MNGTASPWPIWRTAPAGFSMSGYLPILTTLILSCVLVPLIGVISVSLIDFAGFRASPLATPSEMTAMRWVYGLSTILVFSPVVAWVFGLIALRDLGQLATAGYAGWGATLLLGVPYCVFLALIVSYLAEFRLGAIGANLAILIPIGLIYGGVCWLVLKTLHPSFLGLPRKETS